MIGIGITFSEKEEVTYGVMMFGVSLIVSGLRK